MGRGSRTGQRQGARAGHLLLLSSWPLLFSCSLLLFLPFSHLLLGTGAGTADSVDGVGGWRGVLLLWWPADGAEVLLLLRAGRPAGVGGQRGTSDGLRRAAGWGSSGGLLLLPPPLAAGGRGRVGWWWRPGTGRRGTLRWWAARGVGQRRRRAAGVLGGEFGPLSIYGFGPLLRAQIQSPRQRFFIFLNILCRGPLARPSAKTPFAEGLARPSAKSFFLVF